MYVIESDIPIPPITIKKAFGPLVRAAMSLEIGQSFVVGPEYKRTIGGRLASVKKKTGRKFVTRIVENGIRVWRVA